MLLEWVLICKSSSYLILKKLSRLDYRRTHFLFVFVHGDSPLPYLFFEGVISGECRTNIMWGLDLNKE
jgi:hypothetical protein